MRDFVIKLRSLRPTPTPPIIPNPVGITVKALSGVSVIQTRPVANLRIGNETFLTLPVSDWFLTGPIIFLRAFDLHNPVVDVVCHPHIALEYGFVFEITPLTNPSQLYSVEFPPHASQAQGVAIHTDLREIFRRTEAFAIEFLALQNRAHSDEERYFLENLPTARSVDTVNPPISSQPPPLARIEPTTQTNRHKSTRKLKI